MVTNMKSFAVSVPGRGVGDLFVVTNMKSLVVSVQGHGVGDLFVVTNMKSLVVSVQGGAVGDLFVMTNMKSLAVTDQSSNTLCWLSYPTDTRPVCGDQHEIPCKHCSCIFCERC